MSLRVKVELVLFIVVGLVVGVSYGIQRFLVLPGLNPLEEKVAQQDMMESVAGIRAQVARLNELCAERATMPATLRVARQGAPQSDPQATDLIRDGLCAAYIVDKRGTVLSGLAIDVDEQKRIELPEFPESSWSEDHPLLRRRSAGMSIRGIYMTQAGPMLVSSNLIHDPENTNIRLGSVIVARRLDDQMLSSLFDRTSLSFRMWPVDSPILPEEERTIAGEIAEGGLSHVTHVSDDRFRVYAVYPDLEGNPALLLRSDVYRNVLAKAYDALQTGLLVQVGIGLAALVVLIVLFRRSVMDSLTELTNHTVAVGKTNDLSARLNIRRNDEIGTLATEFDRTLGKLEEDIEQRKLAEEALRESEERYALAVRGANDGLWDWNMSTNEIHYSDRWKSILGFTEDEVGEKPAEWLDRIHPEDRENVVAAIDVHVSGNSSHFESEHRIKHKAENYLWVLCRGLAIGDEEENAARMAGSMTDITLRKLFEEQLSHQALHDSLTSLPNRALFLDRLNQSLKQMTREEGYMFAVLFLDLDRFKIINDGLGHVVGDTLLSIFAEKLTAVLREGDTVSRPEGTVARFGGDEFVVLLDNIKDVADAIVVAERIHDICTTPFLIDGHEVFTSASIGIALSEEGYTSPEEFVRNADTAMYRAKAKGKACFQIFDADMHEKAMERLQIENDMRRAVERGNEFFVHYQPIVCMDTGKIHAFEALVRWQHPKRGVVPPVEFISIAEETGMIVQIGEFVMREACRQTRVWQERVPGCADLCISVNLSPKQFADPHILQTIKTALSDADMDPHHVKIEITESALMEGIDFVMSTLKRLQDMGVQLAIDDFGTGYSSLSYLHRFPMNHLKIDEAFVRNMHVSEENMQIVRTILLLAQSLGMQVIAEGIETEEQFEVLREHLCEYGQGYHFSKPLSSEDALIMLMSKTEWNRTADV